MIEWEISLTVFFLVIWMLVLTFYVWVGLASKVDLHRAIQKGEKESLEKQIDRSRERTIDDIDDLTLKLNDLREHVLDSDDYNKQRLNALMDYLDLYVRENNSVEIVKKGKKK